MKRLIKPLWLALATLSALLTVVSCVKELAVKEQEVNFESSLTTEQSQIVKGDSTVTTQLLINEEEVDCPRPTKYSVSFTYDEEAGTLFFLGDSIQSGKPIALSSLSNLALTYQAKKLVGNKVDVTVSNDAPKKLSKDLVWNILADKTYWVKSEQEGEGEITITGADDLDAVEPDTKLAVTAKPADGWELVTLTANEEDILEDKSFVVTENTIVRATFKELTPETYAVTLTKEGEGKVAITGADNLDAVVAGSKLTVTATPADGWSIASMTANGVDILASSSFVVESDTNVKVVFKKQPPKTYKVTLVKEGDGTVDISGADDLGAVVAGSKLTVTAEPADGWEISSITANGRDITTDKSFVVTSNTVVKVVFKRLPPKTYKVTLTKEGEGKVGISGADDLGAVVTGSKLTVTATPADGWEVKSITANGKDITTDKSFVVTENTMVRAIFEEKALEICTYTIGLLKEGEGKVVVAPMKPVKPASLYGSGVPTIEIDPFEIDPSRINHVPCGVEVTLIATPADGWKLVSLEADGWDPLFGKSFSINRNTTVHAVFKEKAPEPIPGHTPNEYDYQRSCSIKVLMVDQDTVKLSIPIKQYKEYLNIEAVHVKDEKIYNRFPCHFSEVELSEKIEGLFRCDFFYIDWYRVIQPFLQIKQKKPLRDYTFSHATVNAVGKTIDGTFRKDKIKSLSPTAPILDVLPELAGSYELTRLPLAHYSDHTNPLDNYLEVICFFKRK